MQRLLQKDEARAYRGFFQTVFAVTFITYFVCYLALDPDWIAEVQIELHHHGVLAALDFAIFGHAHDDDEDDEDDD